VALYLADSSIWIGRRRPGVGDLQQRFLDRIRRGEIATCVPVALEVLVGAPDATAYERDWDAIWKALFWLPLGQRAMQRALEVQRELASPGSGGHRRVAVAYLIAACAEDAGPDVVLWHSDDDLTAICEHTGQPHEQEREPVFDLGFIA
jgi:predicted nucleic acid-binding protein